MTTAEPLIGREEELGELARLVDTARVQQRAVRIHIAGPSGSGTSAVLASVPGELHRRRVAHDWWAGRCHAGAPAYHPLIGVLAGLPGGAEDWLTEATRRGAGNIDLVSTLLAAGFVRRLRDHVDAAGRPLVIAIDAIDDGDRSTLDLLDLGLAALEARPLVVLTAGRSAAGVPIHGQVIDLRPLSDNDMLAVLRDDVPSDPEQRDRLLRSLAGRPGHATAWRSAGGPDGGWEHLIRRYEPGGPMAITVAAATGGGLDDVELAACTGAHPNTLRAMVDAGFLVPDEHHRLRPSHDVWVDAAGQIAPLTPAAASAVLERATALSDAGTAYLAGLAGDRIRAVAAWERAADRAADLGAIAAAATALQRAIEVGGPADLTRVGVKAATWSLNAGQRRIAANIAEEVIAVAPRDAHGLRAQAAVVAHRAYFELGNEADADRALDLALEIDDDSATAVEAMVLDSYRVVNADPDAAAARTERALLLAERLGETIAQASALGARALVRSFQGRLDDADADFVRAIELAGAAGALDVEARLASNRVYAMWRAGDPQRVASVAAVELRRLDARGLGALGDQLALLHAIALVQLGDLDDSRVAFAAARRVSMAADAIALTDLCEAELELIVGNTDAARALLARVDRSNGLAVVIGELALRRCELTAIAGDREGAAALALDGLAASDAGDALTRGRLALAARRAGAHPPEVETAPGREGAAIAAELQAHRDPTEETWAATETAWASLPAPLERWRAGLARAEVMGDHAALAVAEREATDAGWHGLAALAIAAQRRLGSRRPGRRTEGALTQREVDVLTLVARGLTNKEIAGRLGMSPRTVGVHVQRCCAKLGASTRGAAAHEAVQRGLISA